MKKIFFILLLLFLTRNVFAEKVELDSGRIIDGQIFEVTDDFIRLYSNDEIVKVRFRNMSIDSQEMYHDYIPKPYVGPTQVEREPGPVLKTYKDYIREGLGLAEQGKFKEAIVAFDEALSIRDNVLDVYLFRAGAYQEMGELDKAIKDYSIVIVRDPERIEAYARRGWVHQMKSEWNKTVEDYSYVLQLDPGNFEILMERYNIYKETKQWWKAKEDIDYILALDPEMGDAYLDQAILNYRLGNYYSAWQSVYEAGKRKINVPLDFIDALKEKLPDPFLAKKGDKERSIFQRGKDFFINYMGFFLAALLAIILAIIVFHLPSKERVLADPLQKAIEGEEELLRIVTFKKTSFFKRVCAGVVDLLVLGILSWVIELMTKPDVFALAFAVFFLFRDSFGASIGKVLVGLQVIDDHGYRGVFLQGFIRNFTFALPVIVFYILFWGMQFKLNWIGQIALLVAVCFFILEGVVILFSKKTGCRIGDRMAGSFVHDLKPGQWRWPYAAASVVLFCIYLSGMIVLNMTFNKVFLYKLYPLRYYNVEREFSIDPAKGWKISSEGEGGLVLENAPLESALVLVYNQEVKDYSLDICVSAFTQSMVDAGLVMRTNEEIQISGLRAFKVGFIDAETDSGILVVYFKKEDFGELYMFQANFPKKNMRDVMTDVLNMIESFRFE